MLHSTNRSENTNLDLIYLGQAIVKIIYDGTDIDTVRKQCYSITTLQ